MMPEWLSFSNGLTVLSMLVAAIAGLVAFRDKAAARTITELRTIIEGLRIDIERITKREAEYHAEKEEQKRRKEIAESNLASAIDESQALREQLVALREVRFFHHWPFLPSDPAPRDPLCPICFGKNVITHLVRHRYGYLGPKAAPGEFDIDLVCEQCSKRVTVNRNIRDGLLEILAKEFEPPWGNRKDSPDNATV